MANSCLLWDGWMDDRIRVQLSWVGKNNKIIIEHEVLIVEIFVDEIKLALQTLLGSGVCFI